MADCLWACVLNLIRRLKVELGSSARFLPLRRSSSSSPLLDNTPSIFLKRLQACHWPRVVLHTCHRQEQGKDSSALLQLHPSPLNARPRSCEPRQRQEHHERPLARIYETAIYCAQNHAKRTSRVLKNLLHFRFTIFPFESIITTCNDYQ